MTAAFRPPPALRREALRDALPDALSSVVGPVARRRAGDIAEGYIDDYVALNWLSETAVACAARGREATSESPDVLIRAAERVSRNSTK